MKGLIKNVKKGGLLLILGIETTYKCELAWGAFGLAHKYESLLSSLDTLLDYVVNRLSVASAHQY